MNSSRQYRKERKERQIKRAMGRSASPSWRPSEADAEKVGGEDDLEEEASWSDDVGTTFRTKHGKRRKGRHRSEKLYIDMYKVLDGSAMMALGDSDLNSFSLKFAYLFLCKRNSCAGIYCASPEPIYS